MDGGAGGCEDWGNSGIHQPTPRERDAGETRKLKPEAKPEDEAREETQSVVGRSNREERSARETESSSTGSTEEREVRGNSNIRCRYSRKIQGPGHTWDLCWEAQLEERSSEATCSRRNRGAEGCESRGNSMIGRRQGRKMQRPGKPVMHQEAQGRNRVVGKPGT